MLPILILGILKHREFSPILRNSVSVPATNVFFGNQFAPP